MAKDDKKPDDKPEEDEPKLDPWSQQLIGENEYEDLIVQPELYELDLFDQILYSLFNI